MTIPYLITSSTISLILENRSYIIDLSHPNFHLIKDALRLSEWSKLKALVDIPRAIVRASRGAFQVTDDAITYNGQVVHNLVCDRILQFLKEDIDFKPLLAFLDRVSSNPSKRSVDELYRFLEHKNLPVDGEGFFYAYKTVRSDFKDKHSGKFDNSVGSVLSMPRNGVDDDARHACSYGFHVGSIEYVRGFAACYGQEGGDHILIVKVDPADVVSVPYDCDCQKVRVTRYEVVGLFEGVLPETTYRTERASLKWDNEAPDDRDWDDPDWDEDEPWDEDSEGNFDEEDNLEPEIVHGEVRDEGRCYTCSRLLFPEEDFQCSACLEIPF